jgi:hypothetical protein
MTIFPQNILLYWGESDTIIGMIPQEWIEPIGLAASAIIALSLIMNKIFLFEDHQRHWRGSVPSIR